MIRLWFLCFCLVAHDAKQPLPEITLRAGISRQYFGSQTDFRPPVRLSGKRFDQAVSAVRSAPDSKVGGMKLKEQQVRKDDSGRTRNRPALLLIAGIVMLAVAAIFLGNLRKKYSL